VPYHAKTLRKRKERKVLDIYYQLFAFFAYNTLRSLREPKHF